MWNVYQSPWLLLLIAFFSFLALGTFRCVFPEKLRLTQWIVPLVIAGTGLGLDYVVHTDLEKIRAALDTLLTSAEIEDVNAIDHLTAPDYRDSFHRSKPQLIQHLHTRFAKPEFERISCLSHSIDPIEGGRTAVVLNVTCVFNKDSDVARVYRAALMAKVKFYLTRQSNGEWKFSQIELLEVDKQPINWSAAISQF